MKLPTYRLPAKSQKKDFIFNIFGSMINACVSVILLVVVSHLLDSTAAGLFTLAYSTAQMMYTVGTFEMRNIQVTDAKHEFTFASVLGYRILSVLLMWVVSAGFILWRGYTGEKAIVIAVICFYMSFLALTDVFQGNMHLNGYLSIAGRSLGLVVTIAAIVFSVALYLSRSLIIAVVSMAAVPILWMLLHDIPYSRNFSGIKPSFNGKALVAIFACAFPLFLSQFLNQFIFNAPKYAIDSFLTATDQANYGYLVMPAFVINLLSIFAFRPQLVSLSENWAKGEYGKFKRTSVILYLWIGIITVCALIGGYFLGIPILNFLYGAKLDGLRGAFMILLLAGCFSACGTLTLTLFTTMRKQRFCLIAYGVTATFALIIPRALVSSHGMIGAASAYLAETTLLFATMIIPMIFIFRNAHKRVVKADTEDGNE